MDIIKADNHLSEQLEYIYELRKRYYIAGFCTGSFNAIKVIDAYLNAGPKSLEIINHYIFPKQKFI